MSLITHLRKQPFLFAVSVAAITHSTWSFAVMFTGLEPHPQFTPAWFAWVIPGSLLSFSIDIGLLSLAYQIRGGQRNIPKLAAFGILSLAMCYAQFVYISSHMPAFPLASGVRGEWIAAAQLIRDCAIWVFPALLPIALVLYAFSDSEETSTPVVQPSPVIETTPDVAVNFIRPEPHHDSMLSAPTAPELPAVATVNSAQTNQAVGWNPDAISDEELTRSDEAIRGVTTHLVDLIFTKPDDESVKQTTPLEIPTAELSISLRKLRTSTKHCDHCGSPLPENSRRKYCNDSCKQLAYVSRKSAQQH